MRNWQRALILMAGLAAISPFASAYYFFVYFNGRTGPFTPVPVKFDLTALSNNTVSYLISDQGPGPLMPGDSFQAVISQIRAAANVWNGIGSSSLRLAFGGLSPMTTPSASPEIDIIFDDDMPPGIIAQTKPVTLSNAGALVQNGAAFVPLVRSVLQLRKDFTNASVPTFPASSYQDAFFTTVVHEFGHSLGLQHTLTSSAMATQITRATTKAAPLTADDTIGVSLLYPAANFQASTGSITGTVSLNGNGVNLASVVALSTSGMSVSGFTNPDGSYRIDGLPAGQYYIYVHPLPPAQQGEAYPDNVIPPQDTASNPFPATTGFGSQFLGGTTDWTQTSPVTVGAGNTTGGINFNVQGRSGPAISAMTTYGYPDSTHVAIGAPPLPSGNRYYLVFAANGILGSDNASVAPGLNVSVIGGSAQIEAGSLRYYTQGFLLAIVDTYTVLSQTPVALSATLNGDVYVLPAALTVVPAGPPSISGVSGTTDALGNSTVTVTGANLGANTRILFDGAPANVLQVNQDGSLTVAAPPASAGFQAAVEALGVDSQTSLQALGTGTPPLFNYGGPGAPSISVSPQSVTAGTDSMVEVIGYSTNFVEGQTVIGFGSSDVVVNHVWVISPGHLQLNVSVNGAAQPAVTTISVASGLQLATLTATFQITPAVPGQVTLRTPILNAATQLAGIPAGGTALINTSGLLQNLPGLSLAGWTLTIGSQATAVTLGPNGQLIATVPLNLLPGPSVVRLTAPNGAYIPPVIMQVDLPSPVITSAVNSAGAAVDSTHAAQAGDTIAVTVSGLTDVNNNVPAAQAIDVAVGGVHLNPTSVTLVGAGGTCLLQLTVPANLVPGPQAVTVRVGTRLSASYTIFTR